MLYSYTNVTTVDVRGLISQINTCLLQLCLHTQGTWRGGGGATLDQRRPEVTCLSRGTGYWQVRQFSSSSPGRARLAVKRRVLCSRQRGHSWSHLWS